MAFAILFFISFVVGLIVYLSSNRWWMGGLLVSIALVVFAMMGFEQSALRGVALFFGFPIVFLGSLFGAYIVQLRRAPELSDDQEVAERASDNKN